jgi:hypothetical protein
MGATETSKGRDSTRPSQDRRRGFALTRGLAVCPGAMVRAAGANRKRSSSSGSVALSAARTGAFPPLVMQTS